MPKIPAAYLDRLRERPLEAGATTAGSSGTYRNGANSCGAGPMPESGRWAVDCAGFCRRNGLRALALQGLCKPLWSERYGAENSLIQVDQTLRLPQPFTLYFGDVLPDAKVAFRL